jgi:hydroxyethylthiazole kinase-like sugar kinase family protein
MEQEERLVFFQVYVDHRIYWSIVLEFDRIAIASLAARKFNTTVVMSGRYNIITDGNTCILVRNGHEALNDIAGISYTLNTHTHTHTHTKHTHTH